MESFRSPIQSSTIARPDSSAEHTLQVMHDRLKKAEQGVAFLSKNLHSYGFKDVGKENVLVEVKSNKREDVSNPLNVARMCKLESIIDSLKSAMTSLQEERSTEVDRLHSENKQFKKQQSKLTKDLEAVVKSHENLQAKYSKQKVLWKKELDKKTAHISELEGDVSKVIDEKCSVENRLQEVQDELVKEQTQTRKKADEQELLSAEVARMEVCIETEQRKCKELHDKCETLTNDTLAARQEFEKEFGCRLKLEELVEQQGKDIESNNKETEQLINENQKLSQANKALKQELSGMTKSLESVKKNLDAAKICNGNLNSENTKLKQALKMAASENQAVIAQHKDLITVERSKITDQLAEQEKIFDSAKETILKELSQEKSRAQEYEKEKNLFKRQTVELEQKLREVDFETKLAQHSSTTELANLKEVIKELTVELEKAKIESSDIEKKMQLKIKCATEERLSVSKELYDMKVTAERLSRSLLDANTAKERFVAEIESYQEQVEVLNAELASLRPYLSENRSLVAEVEKSNKRLFKAQEELKRAEGELTGMWALKSDMGHKDEQNKDLKSELTEMKTSMSALKSKLRTLEKSVRDKDRIIEDSKQKYHSSKEKLVEEMQRQHSDECNKLRRQYLEARSCLKGKEEKLKLQEQKMENMIAQLDELEKSKNLYVSKNTEQAKLLEMFSTQISELQTGLSELAVQDLKRKSHRTRKKPH